MDLLEQLLGAQGGALPRQVAGKFGLDEAQARQAMAQLLPALSQGRRKNAAAPGGLDALLEALQSGNHQRYVDNPQEIERPETIENGNGILGHILGSKDVSRQVATRASEKTGLDPGILKKMLPIVAAMAMGALSKQAASSGALSQGRMGAAPGGRGADSLLSLLDFNKDGSIADDLLGLAKKFFK
ncbi:DUF937 domain-containing protein [Geoalkalibacter sp.]|uniref:DUF937 domain-containing protein n=1 Tax=Geoalkalibacter sp. TaxID=3041440 RepID=UPI00272ED059|nr:DUF937 domain-containing protein [Geoalkalibacter sp.]